MKTVALIDDDPGVLEALGMLLTSRGLHHASYSSADAFLSAPPCGGCVVSDLRMPGLNGLELLTALQSIHDQRPVILLTAHGDVELAVRALKQGAFDFIEKPFEEARLLQAITAAGCSNKEVAARLGLSIRTVETYRAWVLEKMQTKTLADLVRASVQLQEVLEAEDS